MNRTIRGAMNLLHVILLLFIAAILFAVLFPVTLHSGSPAPITTTVSSSKYLTIAFLMYASDYDEKPPFVHPFEFGIDPLDPYLKNSELHSIPFPPHQKQRKPGTTDFHFQYVLQKQMYGSHPTRIVLGPISRLDDPVKTIIYTGTLYDKKDKEVIVTAFADGHVKRMDRSKLKVALPPTIGTTIPILNLNELLYVLPDDINPPKFWLVPNVDVERYGIWAKWQKK